MKKIISGILIFVSVILIAVYGFIPGNMEFKANSIVKATRPGLYRMLTDTNQIVKWWPGAITNGAFKLHGFTYTIHENNISVLPVEIKDEQLQLSTALYFMQLRIDSTSLQWSATLPASMNPVERIGTYFKARKIQHDMQDILDKFAAFCAQPDNIYGFSIKNEFVTDSLLIMTSADSKGYPTKEFVYDQVDKLTKYITAQSAMQAGYPMLNISALDSINFIVKVAIPVNKSLPNTKDISLKRMLGGGNILTTETRGGIIITDKALDAMEKFVADYERIPPAIPFLSLITDRRKEPDSSKWITKVYFPVK